MPNNILPLQTNETIRLVPLIYRVSPEICLHPLGNAQCRVYTKPGFTFTQRETGDRIYKFN